MNQEERELRIRALDFQLERETKAQRKWNLLGVITASIGGFFMFDALVLHGLILGRLFT